MNRLAALLLPVLLLPPALAADPVVANRSPHPDEIGYRPADGSVATLNPPSFAWLHEPAAAAYLMQWAGDSNFTAPAGAGPFMWNTYTHCEPLAPGRLWWRYRFVTAQGVTSTWSAARSVTIPSGAREMPMPTRAQQRERVPAGHPRLFLRPEDLPRLRELAHGKEARSFADIRKAADRAIAAGPTPEPEHLGSATDKDNDELVKYWWPNREQTQKACEEAEAIAFTWLISQEPKYRDAARKWIMHLASWNPDGPTNFKLNCEAGKVMLYRPARAYDWAWDALTEEDRARFRTVQTRRVLDAWKSGEVAGGTGHLNRPYNSHGNRVWHKIAETGIALLGETPEAETWLDYAVNKFFACYPVWSDDDGGWHEGVSYWSGYMTKAVWWLQVAQSALAIDGLKKPFFSQVGDYPMYIAPPHSPTMGFGDLSWRPLSSGSATFMEYFVRTKGAQPENERAAHWRWWMDQNKTTPQGGILGFLYRANLPDLPAAQAPTNLPVSKVFHGIGVASLHATLLDSRDDVHFLMKSSPFGTQSHGHNAHNTFQLNAYGECLLPACTYRDLHGSKFHYRWVHSTRAQNGVLVNGEGQRPHTSSPDGRIVAFTNTPDYDVVAGDATAAYGGRLTLARRTAVFIKPDLIVLFDELAAREPSTFQFMLHGLSAFAIDATTDTLRLERPRAGLSVHYLSPVPLDHKQTDGFDPKPKKEFPNQWHVETGTRTPLSRLAMITVLAPHRAGKAATVKAERVDSPGAVGLRLAHENRRWAIALRRQGEAGPVEWSGTKLNADYLVRPLP